MHVDYISLVQYVTRCDTKKCGPARPTYLFKLHDTDAKHFPARIRQAICSVCFCVCVLNICVTRTRLHSRTHKYLAHSLHKISSIYGGWSGCSLSLSKNECTRVFLFDQLDGLCAMRTGAKIAKTQTRTRAPNPLDLFAFYTRLCGALKDNTHIPDQ